MTVAVEVLVVIRFEKYLRVHSASMHRYVLCEQHGHSVCCSESAQAFMYSCYLCMCHNTDEHELHYTAVYALTIEHTATPMTAPQAGLNHSIPACYATASITQQHSDSRK